MFKKETIEYLNTHNVSAINKDTAVLSLKNKIEISLLHWNTTEILDLLNIGVQSHVFHVQNRVDLLLESIAQEQKNIFDKIINNFNFLTNFNYLEHSIYHLKNNSSNQYYFLERILDVAPKEEYLKIDINGNIPLYFAITKDSFAFNSILRKMLNFYSIDLILNTKNIKNIKILDYLLDNSNIVKLDNDLKKVILDYMIKNNLNVDNIKFLRNNEKNNKENSI